MNKKIFIYLLFMLVILSATVGAVSASANATTESALLSVDESYIGDDVVLSSSNEVSIENDDKTFEYNLFCISFLYVC